MRMKFKRSVPFFRVKPLGTAVCETSFKIDFFTEPQNPRRERTSTNHELLISIITQQPLYQLICRTAKLKTAMPPARSSKRLQARASAPEQSPNRPGQRNKNALTEFNTSQTALRHRPVARKRDRGGINLPEANTDDNLVPGTPIIIPSDSVVPPSSPLNGTPLPKRAKKAIQPPPPLFDPSIK
jgi:hypothetical protein